MAGISRTPKLAGTKSAYALRPSNNKKAELGAEFLIWRTEKIPRDERRCHEWNGSNVEGLEHLVTELRIRGDATNKTVFEPASRNRHEDEIVFDCVEVGLVCSIC
jgi:hypothetical protein